MASSLQGAGNKNCLNISLVDIPVFHVKIMLLSLKITTG